MLFFRQKRLTLWEGVIKIESDLKNEPEPQSSEFRMERNELILVGLLVLGGIFFYYEYYDRCSVTEIHVLVGRYSNTGTYFINNAWVEDTKISKSEKEARDEISGLFTINIDLTNESQVDIFNTSVGLKSLFGEHVILWDEPINGTFTMDISLREGTRLIASKQFPINYPIGG